jgi:hypothetical protein
VENNPRIRAGGTQHEGQPRLRGLLAQNSKLILSAFISLSSNINLNIGIILRQHLPAGSTAYVLSFPPM